ncbi:MAG TPA: LamG-like jellyroll fold domain-containing protein [Verrucomicrobiae bacterium]
MKTLLAKKTDWRTKNRHIIAAGACLLAGALSASAAITVQGWWHLDATQPVTDSSGNGRNFGSAFSTAPSTGGVVGAQLIANGAGGPLDSTGWTSSQCVRVGVGVGGRRQSAMWSIGYNPPAQNFGIEMWILPVDNGLAPQSAGNADFFASGESGGVALRINSVPGGTSYIDAHDLSGAIVIGGQAPIDTNKWMHVAIVNAGGITTFYTNGVACGTSLTTPTSASAGFVTMLASQSDNSAFYGYLDEGRMFTFAAGQFSTNDLLLRPPGPNLLAPPQNDVVWSGGAAPFSVIGSFDSSLAYQWFDGSASIPDATNANYFVPVATPGLSGSAYKCELTADGLAITSAPATLTVVAPNAANVAAYRNAITSTAGLIAYFPVDGSTGLVVTNTVNASYNGTLEDGATYDGRTNRSFGERALSFNSGGDVEVPNNTGYEFASGNGTIEALVYLSQAPATAATIVSENFDGLGAYYALQVDTTGGFLLYNNDSPASLSWAVPGGFIGQVAHVAVVIDHSTNVTAYVNGQSLGTQIQNSFGTTPGGSFWIGNDGSIFSTNNGWAGTIDELAVYATALPAATVQGHYTKYIFGTNTVPPVIVSQSSSKTLLAGGSPVLSVGVTGALPINFQWTSNSVPIAGATSSTLVLSHTTTASTAVYAVSVNNAFGGTNSQPITLTFVAPQAGYVSKIMSDNPTAFWRLADSGSTAVDSAGLNDANYSASGVTHSVGGPIADPAAGAGFDGSSGRAVTPANFPDLNPGTPFSMEFWAKLTVYNSVGTTGRLYSPFSSMPRPSRSGGYEWYMGGNSSGYEFHTAESANYSLLTADNGVPPTDAWWYLTGIWDGTNLYLYVNGQLGNDQIDPPAPAGTDNFIDEGLGQTQFVPNTSVPFYIGSRSDGADYFNGQMADVAFYNYALSYEQVTNHWSYGWVPASVASSPPGFTNAEGSTITIAPAVTGIPNSYQWYYNGNPLSDSANADGTAHFPNDVTNASLVIADAVPTDSGEYQLFITNPTGNSQSAQIKVLVTASANPPVIASVTALGTPNTGGGPTPYLVKVVYSARVDTATGGNPANYVFSPAVAIQSMTLFGSGPNDLAAASLGSDWRVAILTTAGLTPGQKYSLTVSGVKDQSQTPLTIPATTVPFRAPVLTTGVVGWDYYYLGNSDGGQVAVLQGDPYFPNSPQTNSYFTSFDSDQTTGGDLNNNPAFGALGDNYGDSVSGWVTPPVSGDYTFFLWSDDGGALYLSSDSNPANQSEIVFEPSAGSGFIEPTNTSPGLLTSSPITLTGGTPYFIQALHAEGGGGDYVKVAWRISTDNTPASSLQPIPGAYLSAYAPVAQPKFNAPALAGGILTLNWSGPGTIQQSADLIHWTNVPGNPSPLVVNVSSATATFYRIVQ